MAATTMWREIRKQSQENPPKQILNAYTASH